MKQGPTITRKRQRGIVRRVCYKLSKTAIKEKLTLSVEAALASQDELYCRKVTRANRSN